MSSDLRNRLALATLLGAAVIVGPTLEPAAAADDDNAEERTVSLSSEDRSRLQLTVYPRNVAMIAEQRKADIQSGRQILRIGGLPNTVMDDTLLIGADPKAGMVWSEIHSNLNGQIGIYQLLRGQIGKTVAIRRDDDLVSATLLSLDGGALVKTAKGIEQVNIDQIVLTEYPAESLNPPAIAAHVSATGKSDHISLAYLLGGISWQTAYVGQYDNRQNRLTWSAMAHIVNQTGSEFANAELRLVAGDQNRAGNPVPMVKAMRSEMMSAMSDGISPSPAPGAETMENLYVYGPYLNLTMQDGDAVTLPLLAEQSLPVTRHVIFQGNSSTYYGAISGMSEFVRPSLEIEIENSAKSAPANPWPAGLVRIYGQSESGITGLIGEDNLALTPAGRKAILHLGQASDISAIRKVTKYDRKARPNMPDDIRATMEWTIHNGSARNETVTLRESMPDDWMITDETSAHETQQPGQISWNIAVPAGKDVTLRWSVQSAR